MFEETAKALLAVEQPRAAASLRPFLGIGGGGAKWRGGLAHSGAMVILDHTTARRNARAAMQDSPHARAIVERSAGTVADGGLRLEFSPVIEVLGIPREQATKWAREREAAFHLWAQGKKAHRAEQMNFYQSQQMYQLYNLRDNDQFVWLTYDDKDRELQNPLQFEFIDPDQVRGDAQTMSIGFNSVQQDGIVRDARGREIAYKVFTRKPDGTGYNEQTIPKRYPGGRLAMLHGCKTEYAGQGRGYSRLAHALQEFENITDFGTATLKKAIAQSSIVAFVEPSKDEDAVNPFEKLLTNEGAGPAAQLFGSNPQAVEGVAVTPTLTPGIEASYQLPEATLDTPGSMFVANLTKGSTIKTFANTAPGDSYDKFVDAFAGNIAASLNIPLEVVLMKFGQNYSASRATLLLFWRVCCIERDEMATDYLNPVVEAWLSEEIAAGRCVAPGWSDPRLRAAWCNCTWIGSSAPDIDPAKSAKARRENIELGVTNVEREARDLNGTSAAANIAVNNDIYGAYEDLPWNEKPEPVVAPAAGKPAAAWLDAIREVMDEYRD